ncbi:MAG TPA: ABC transporter permease, partial [Chitinophagaceae bacterium]|nr:ABC transporter permease [Chitinophagaceae bacterium]
MLKNYFKIAFRNLRKNKIFSGINILGLALGLACCMLIASFVFNELNYDKFPENAKQIYRVQLNVTGNGSVETYTNVDVAVGPGMKNTYPEIQAYTRLVNSRETFVKYDDKEFKEKKLAFVDSNYLRFFSIPFLEGDPAKALVEPNSIVITKAFAGKYFGQEEPFGKQLTMGNSTYKVTGLIDKIPDNSHFHFDAFMSLSSFGSPRQTWSNLSYFTYLLLDKNAAPESLEAKFPELVKKYVVPETMHDMGVSLAEAQKTVNTFRFSLEPLNRIHLYSNTKYELEPNGDIQYVYIFSALAIFIMLLACVNFTNLSTAASSKRAREVGMRKVMGSEKKQLIIQFLVESILLTYLAIFFAFIIMYALLPYFNRLSGKHIEFVFFFRWQSIIPILSLGLLVGIISGIYPAFFLSSFNITSVLKGASSTSTHRKSILR